VVDVKVLRGLPMGSRAAIEALQKTKFKPATMNGRPVAVYYVLTVTFKIRLRPGKENTMILASRLWNSMG